MLIPSVKRYLQWELGSIPRDNLEDLIIEHLDTQRELQKLEEKEFQLLCLLIYGYNQTEICSQTGLNPRTVARRLLRIRTQMLKDLS